MKIILTGANGFIGAEILSLALSHRSISSLIAISRKPLSIIHQKLKNVVLEDFSSYPPDILSQLAGAEACIWTLGAKSTSAEVTRQVTVEYSLTAARAFSDAARREGTRFRFVFVSGVLAVRDQESRVLVYGGVRKVAGEAEAELLALAKSHPDSLETCIMRPAAVLSKEKTMSNAVMGCIPYSVRVDELASVLLDVAVNGAAGRETWENADLRRRGGELVLRGEK